MCVNNLPNVVTWNCKAWSRTCDLLCKLKIADSLNKVSDDDELSHTHTHTHPFNGPFSGTTRVSRYQKGKTNPDFPEARDGE